MLVNKLNRITAHSYIAKSQAQYLKQRKFDLSDDEAIVMLDFAENYQFIVQDKIQGFHGNGTQCTLHPVVIYTKNGGDLNSESLCFISDDLHHNFNLEFIECFSDGCAAQYKNCKKLFKHM